MGGGFGLGAWGRAPFGIGGGLGLLQVISATAVAENRVQVAFSATLYFSKLLDPYDGSSRHRYTLTPVSGSVDQEGDPTRPVLPTLVEVDPAGDGSQVVVTLDRPLSSWPSMYLVAVNQLAAQSGAPLDPAHTSATFSGVQYDSQPLAGANKMPVGSGDFANPQTLSGVFVGASPQQAAVLGSYPVAPSGDYATDRGLESYRKRILRRLTSRRGGFAALSPSYGLSAMDRVKQLQRPGAATALAAEAEEQVLADPETRSAKVTFVPQAGYPQIGYLSVVAVHVSGQVVQDVRVPVSVGG